MEYRNTSGDGPDERGARRSLHNPEDLEQHLEGPGIRQQSNGQQTGHDGSQPSILAQDYGAGGTGNLPYDLAEGRRQGWRDSSFDGILQNVRQDMASRRSRSPSPQRYRSPPRHRSPLRTGCVSRDRDSINRLHADMTSTSPRTPLLAGPVSLNTIDSPSQSTISERSQSPTHVRPDLSIPFDSQPQRTISSISRSPPLTGPVSWDRDTVDSRPRDVRSHAHGFPACNQREVSEYRTSQLHPGTQPSRPFGGDGDYGYNAYGSGLREVSDYRRQIDEAYPEDLLDDDLTPGAYYRDVPRRPVQTSDPFVGGSSSAPPYGSFGTGALPITGGSSSDSYASSTSSNLVRPTWGGTDDAPYGVGHVLPYPNYSDQTQKPVGVMASGALIRGGNASGNTFGGQQMQISRPQQPPRIPQGEMFSTSSHPPTNRPLPNIDPTGHNPVFGLAPQSGPILGNPRALRGPGRRGPRTDMPALIALPILREIPWRDGIVRECSTRENSRRANYDRGIELSQRGHLAPSPCGMCRRGRGSFIGCYIVIQYGIVKPCANCSFQAQPCSLL